jgi:hypothetical protein
MFGLFKRKTVSPGPIPFDFEIVIERPVADVYALIDWADPKNAKRQLGHRVEGEHPNYVLTINSMPDHRFVLDVTEAVAGEVYAFDCDIQPRVGRLKHSSERYTFEATGEGHTLLRLVNEAEFNEGLTIRQLEQEMMMMAVATNDSLAKLKILAEQGAEAGKSVENISSLDL